MIILKEYVKGWLDMFSHFCFLLFCSKQIRTPNPNPKQNPYRVKESRTAFSPCTHAPASCSASITKEISIAVELLNCLSVAANDSGLGLAISNLPNPYVPLVRDNDLAHILPRSIGCAANRNCLPQHFLEQISLVVWELGEDPRLFLRHVELQAHR